MTIHLAKILTPLMSSRNYKAGETLTPDLAKSGCVFLVSEGAVVVEFVSITTDKDRRIGTLFTDKGFLGLENLFLQRPDAKAQATVLRDSTILSMPTSAVLELLDNGAQSTKLCIEVSTALAEATYGLRHRLEALALHANYPKENVFSILRYLGKHLGISNGKGGITIPVKVGTLATLTGLSEESTRRAISLLVEEQRVAKIGKGNFLIFA